MPIALHHFQIIEYYNKEKKGHVYVEEREIFEEKVFE